MKLSRRGFLGALSAALATATLDPERLLWVPGAKVYSIPARQIILLPGAEEIALRYMIKKAEKSLGYMAELGDLGEIQALELRARIADYGHRLAIARATRKPGDVDPHLLRNMVTAPIRTMAMGRNLTVRFVEG